MIVLHETGLLDQVRCERSVVAYAARANAEVLADNPLGKIPALVLDDGTCLFDSPVICEYLDQRHSGPRLLPDIGHDRFRHLRWQALGDGMMDIMILWRNEQMRPGGQHPVIAAGFDSKLRASLALLDRESGELSATAFGLGHVAVACTIGQLDFRFADCNWRQAYPALAAWYEQIEQRASVKATMPVDDPSPVAAASNQDELKSPIDFMGMPV